MSRKFLATLGAVVALGSQACAPTCAQTCNKLDRCDLLAEVPEGYCETSCSVQISDYTGLERDEKQDELVDAFNDQRRCIASSTCDDLADGVCYDETLFPF